jgi:hypothetical protein
MKTTRLSLIVFCLAGLSACAAPPPPAPQPSDEQPIQASPSTPVERQAEPALDPLAPQTDKDHPAQTH